MVADTGVARTIVRLRFKPRTVLHSARLVCPSGLGALSYLDPMLTRDHYPYILCTNVVIIVKRPLYKVNASQLGSIT